jgi:hypothetical protein
MVRNTPRPVVPLSESTDAARLILDCLLVVSVRPSLQRQASSIPDNTQSEQVWKASPLSSCQHTCPHSTVIRRLRSRLAYPAPYIISPDWFTIHPFRSTLGLVAVPSLPHMQEACSTADSTVRFWHALRDRGRSTRVGLPGRGSNGLGSPGS